MGGIQAAGKLFFDERGRNLLILGMVTHAS